MLLLDGDELDRLDAADIAACDARSRWLRSARTRKRAGKQIPPPDLDWEILLFRAGRGFGKSRALYEPGWWEAWRCPGIIVHAIAPTLSDARGTTFEGPAGFCSLIPPECLKGGSLDKAYNKTTHEIRLSNGSLIRGFGAVDEGARLRGPQAHLVLGDEIAQWDKPAGNLERSLNNALYGLRLPYPDGTPARAILATTPLPIPFLKRLEKRLGVRVVTGNSYENLENLSPSFRTILVAQAGTLMGRQEIDGLYIDEESDLTIIKRHWIKLFPATMADGAPRKLPPFMFVLESYDTASSEENYDAKQQNTDPSGSIVLGIFNAKDAFTPAELSKLGIKSKYAAMLLDAWTERLGLPELLDKARAQHRTKWGSPGRRADVVIIEDKSSGPALRQFLAKWGVPCWPYNPGRSDKTMRAHAIAPLIKQGMFFVPESARPDRKGLPRDWCEPFLEQVCGFAGPGSVEHDEYVDVLTQAMSYLRDRSMLDATPDEKYIDYEEKLADDREEAARLRDEARHRMAENPYS